MTSIQEIVEKLANPEYKGFEEEILFLWDKEIINECTASAMVEELPPYISGGDYSSYIVNKESILKVKELLK